MNKDIAIIGMAGRFPDAANLTELFDNLKNGKDSVREISPERIKDTALPPGKPYYIAGYLEDIDKFDHKLFNISLGEAQTMSPVQRQLLEVVYETFENSGYGEAFFRGTNTAVFVGASDSNYYLHADQFLQTLLSGNLNAYLPAKIARAFDLTGSAQFIDTACSSSLVALYNAYNELILGNADYALVCGANIHIFPYSAIPEMSDNPMNLDAPDGKSKAFSANANGMSRGEMAACVLLKPLDKALADHDIIHAVIKSVVTNNNANRSASPTAVDSVTQSVLLKKAWSNAQVNAEEIGYIEAHGSGTQLGDALEIEGLNLAFRGSGRMDKCPISTIKSNIGHGRPAAGIAGLIKTVLSLKNGVIFPTIHCAPPTPLVNFEEAAVSVNEVFREWTVMEGETRCAGVTSLGESGINCHAILAEAPLSRSFPDITNQGPYLITFSAKTVESLRRNMEAMLARVNDPAAPLTNNMPDISYTMNTGREHYPLREAFIAESIGSLKEQLAKSITNVGQLQFTETQLPPELKKLIFVFSNHDEITEEQINALASRYPVFKEHSDECRRLTSEFNRNFYTFTFQYSFCKLLETHGIFMENVLEINVGEILCSVISGEMLLAEGIRKAVDYKNKELTELDRWITRVIAAEVKEEPAAFIENGPESVAVKKLKAQSAVNASTASCFTAFSLYDGPKAGDPLLELFRKLYLLNYKVNWAAFHQNHPGNKMELPGYQFEKTRCWLRDEPRADVVGTNVSSLKLIEESATDIQLKIAGYWQEVLKINKFSVSDDFFEIGGDSLKATAVINRINRELALNLSFEDLFDYPTLQLFSEYIDSLVGTIQKLGLFWREVLKIEDIKPEDNFFELGGHSLLASLVLNRIKKEFKLELNFEDVFNYPTLKTLAARVDNLLSKGNEKTKFMEIAPAPLKEYYPLSSAQKRMYILNKIDREQLSYNTPGAMIIEGALDLGRFETVMRNLVKRHESFRSSFVVFDGEPAQRIHPEVAFGVECTEAPEEEMDLIIRDFVRPFDLSKAPLLRMKLVKTAPFKYILLYDMHHIIFDGFSTNILLKEFAALYDGHSLPELKIQYHDYSEWQNKQFATGILKEQEEYWLNVLKNIKDPLAMPLDFKRPNRQTFGGQIQNFTIPKETAAQLQDLANKQKLTLNALLFAVYTLLLHKYSDQADIVVGSLVAGRSHVDLEKLIGLFINFLPVRQIINPDSSIKDFMELTHKRLQEAYQNQDYPFEEMVEKSGIKTGISRNPLFDTMFVFHNEMDPQAGMEIEGLKFSPYPMKKAASTLDFKLDAFLNNRGEIICALEYNTDLFKPETMDDLKRHFIALTGFIISDPDRKIAALELFTEDEKIKLREKISLNHAPREKTTPVAISATFTAEPVAEYIIWWCKQFHENVTVRFAPYNQVFQEILDPEGLLSVNSGINILLVRFEDWIRYDQSSEAEKCHKLEQNFAELTALLKSKVNRTSYFIGLFPVASHLLQSGPLVSVMEGLNRRLRILPEELPNIHLIDFSSLGEDYDIDEIFDKLTDETGHLPFSDRFYAAMGAEISRKICAWKQQEQFKVIVLDGDNTLWKGVCGEDGALGVEVTDPYRELQRFMVQKSNEGMLLALCSKNNEADLWEVFEKNPGMILKKEHLVTWRINWQDKPANLASIAAELNLGLDSFIFIDDSPVECLQMMNACPNTLTLRLPDVPEQIPSFLRHVWAFDRFKVTTEDRQRKEMYQAERKRLETHEESLSLTDFIRGLELKISMKLMSQLQLNRVAQLTQRTNQFNLSSIRRTEGEIKDLIALPGYKCWTVEVSDRFGDYGLVGVVITQDIKYHQDKESYLAIDTFLLSCRVLGRTVEDAVLTGLQRYCREEGLSSLETKFYATEKNGLFKEFIESTRWEKIEENNDYIKYRLAVEKIKDPGLVEFYYKTGFEKAAVRARPLGDENGYVELGNPVAAAINHPRKMKNEWDVLEENMENLLHHNQLLPLINHTGEKLLRLPVPVMEVKSTTVYEPPRTGTEEKLAAIWSKILGVERIGIKDNFFELGGNSLRATTLISKIHQEFNIELQLGEIFDNPTIKKMAPKIEGAVQNAYTAIETAPVRDFYPVSPAQKRMYILNRIEKGETKYNNPGAVIIDGAIDRNRLETAIRQLLRRHESFRTSFEMADGEPVQRIQEQVDLKIDYWNLADGETVGATGRSPEHSPVQDIIAEFIRPFDLSKAPLLRVGLAKIEENRHILMYDMHHIISDGISMRIMIRDFINLYNGDTLPELRAQYKDFTEWQIKLLQSEVLKKREAYWLEQYAWEIPALNLPTDYPRPSMQSAAGESIVFELRRELAGGLNRLALENGATLHMVLLAAFNILLSKYAGQEDIVIGVPVSGRRHVDLDNIIGMFINTLALRNRPEGRKTFKEFLGEVKENALKAYEHQDYQFETLVEKLEKAHLLERDLSRNPLFDVMFILQNMDYTGGEIEGLRFIPYPVETGAAKFDLTLQGAETGAGGISFSLEYGTRLFKRETMERMIGHFQRIIEEIVSAPEKKIAEMEMLSPAEKNLLLNEFNNTTVEYPKEKTVHGLFEEQATRTPDKTAVSFEAQSLTYRELNERANRLAHKLVALGIKPEEAVGLLVDRSLEMVTGVIAILKAGAVCLPVDTKYPMSRVKALLLDSGARFVLTSPAPGRAGYEIPDFPGMQLSINEEDVSKYSENNPQEKISSDALAYLIYTSGSTGKPKGVRLNHFGIINHAFTKIKETGLTGEDLICHNLSISFVASIWLIFAPLIKGAGIVIYPDKVMANPYELFKQTLEDGISIVEIVPSLLNSYLEMVKAGEARLEFNTMRKIILTGERVTPELVNKFYQEYRAYAGAKTTVLMNAYGQSECSDDTLHYQIPYSERTEKVLLGKPSQNTRIYILGKDNQLQPIGIPGELCISGDGLAAGYLNSPDLTAEKFVPNPFYSERCSVDSEQYSAYAYTRVISEGVNTAPEQFHPSNFKLQTSIIYRTGDYGRWLPDGNVEFLGRIDHQVKIRGNRVELGEIESRLLQYTQIKAAAVIDREDAQGEKYLCACLVAEKELALTELRKYLAKNLPEYMIPAYYLQLEKLPLNPNGKIDRKTLAALKIDTGIGTEYVAPGNAAERKMAQIWQELLQVDKVGVNDNFFELGGNSLLAVKLHVEMKKAGIFIEVMDIIRHKTIKEMTLALTCAKDIPANESDSEIITDARASYTLIQDKMPAPSGSSKKILAGIEPFNKIFYKNCFYNSAFPIAAHFQKSILPFLINDVNIYELQQREHNAYLAMEYSSRDTMENVMDKEGIQTETRIAAEDIIRDVTEAIKKERPVIIWVDCFYAKIRKDTYLKNHLPHTWLIYGYDEADKVFYIIEHKHKDDPQYEKCVVGFQEVHDAYQGFLANLQQGRFHTYYAFFIKENDNTIHDSTGNGSGSYLELFTANLKGKKAEIFSGLESLKLFAPRFTQIVNDSQGLTENAAVYLQGLNDIINAKQVEKYKIVHLFETEDKLLDLLDKIITEWTYVRIVIAKFLYSSEYEIEELTVAAGKIDQIYELELEYYNLLYEKIEKFIS